LLSEKSCAACGFTWSRFLREEHLGCPACYDAFRQQLIPMLRQHHRSVEPQAEPMNLREQVQSHRRQEWVRRQDAAIAREDYEEAGRLRTLLAELP
jgi:protein arginine kinase activator